MPNRPAWTRWAVAMGVFVLILAVFGVVDRWSASGDIPVSGRTRGNADAKVTLVEFADFQ
jgi:hypothetical protein